MSLASMRGWIAAVLLLFLLIHSPDTAQALSCAKEQTAAEEWDRSTAVFRGTVLNVSGERVAFQVHEVWKGAVGSRIQVQVSTMWIPMKRGEEHLVYASDSTGKLTAHLCGRTGLWEKRAADAVSFPTPGMPPGAPSRYPELPWIIPAFAAAVTLGGIGAGLYIRRARQRRP